MNKPKYFIENASSILAIVYEDEKYGRTMVVNSYKINFNSNINIYDAETSTKIKDVDLIEFLQSLLPRT